MLSYALVVLLLFAAYVFYHKCNFQPLRQDGCNCVEMTNTVQVCQDEDCKNEPFYSFVTPGSCHLIRCIVCRCRSVTPTDHVRLHRSSTTSSDTTCVDGNDQLIELPMLS